MVGRVKNIARPTGERSANILVYAQYVLRVDVRVLDAKNCTAP